MQGSKIQYCDRQKRVVRRAASQLPLLSEGKSYQNLKTWKRLKNEQPRLAALLYLLLDLGQLHPHHTLQMLPMMSQHSHILRQEGTQSISVFLSLQVSNLGPGVGVGRVNELGVSFCLSPPALGGPGTLPQVTSFSETL